MIITDHYRPAGCPTTYAAMAAPVGSRADIVLVYIKKGRAWFHRLDDGRPPQEAAVAVSDGWSSDRIIEQMGRNELPYGAMPLPQLVPFRSRAPIIAGLLAGGPKEPMTVSQISFRPWPGTTTSRFPYSIVSSLVETGEGLRETSSFLLRVESTRTGTPARAVLASGPDGRLACGRVMRLVPHYLKSADLCSIPGLSRRDGTDYLIGDSGHGIWAYRNQALLFVPEGEGPNPRVYAGLFEDLHYAHPHPVEGWISPDRSQSLLFTAPPAAVQLLAVSPNHAIRIWFKTDKDGDVEMVFDRRRLDPYSGRFEMVDGWTVPTGLPQQATQQQGVCAFISPGEEALMTYIPVYEPRFEVGVKQLLVRTICMDLE